MKTLIITDNQQTYEIAAILRDSFGSIDIYQSVKGVLKGIKKINISRNPDCLCNDYNLLISIHCKQLIPSRLLRVLRCVNVHPGYNPYNRGWFPHVFSIINGLKTGVTIHEIDEKIDHGPIIVQKEYVIKPWDTSETVYQNLIKMEKELLIKHFKTILEKQYHAKKPKFDGNINYHKDFNKLRQINLDKIGSYRDLINHLRALSHAEYENAFFIDESGNKVFVRLILEKQR
jgi:methionyl-tRNA formyltransferase